MFLWGTSGSGKTLMLAEALKMKISQLKRQGKKDIGVIVSIMFGFEPLLKDLQEKYLPDIDRESFVMIDDFAKKNNVEYDPEHPQSSIKNILSSLSAQHSESSTHTILLVDEVGPMSKEESEQNDGKADWSSLTSRESVDFLFALSTFGGNSKALLNVIPPTDSSVVYQRLTTPHRNCKEIATLLKFYVQHQGQAQASTYRLTIYCYTNIV